MRWLLLLGVQRPSRWFGLGIALLIVAWVFGNPPFAAPDELAHYLRALSIGAGEWVGTPGKFQNPAMTEEQSAWVDQATRLVHVPAGLSPQGYSCNAGSPSASSRCIEDASAPPEAVEMATPVGTYQPVMYWLPGVMAQLGSTPRSADWWGRLASALQCAALLALALWAWSRPPYAGPGWLGLGLALTPMVIFLAASLNTSGPEICAGIALMSCLLLVCRAPAPSRLALLGCATAAAALAVSRSIGPAYVAVYALFAAGWGGLGPWRRLARGMPGTMAVTLVVVACALALNRWWEARYGPVVHVGIAEGAWQDAISNLKSWFKEQVGVFQYLDSPMPAIGYWLWWLACLALTLAAGWVATARQRAWLALAALGVVALPMTLHMALIRNNGWFVQGRHVLPMTVAFPLLCGEVLRLRSATLGPVARHGACVLGFAVASVQVIGFWANARRSAVGTSGRWWFFGHPEWSPPGTWWPWLALAFCGAACLFAGALLASREAFVPKGIGAKAEQAPSLPVPPSR